MIALTVPTTSTRPPLTKTSLSSFKKRKTSELMYQPTDSIIKSKILPWGKLPTKDCFLDEVVKADQKNQKLSPGQYKGHDQWSQKLNSVAVNGHIRKG